MRVLVIAVLVACNGPSGPGGPGDDDAVPDAAGSAGGDERLYPLELGRSWSYAVTSTYSSCPAGQHDTKVLAAGTTDGRAAYEVRGFCGLTGHTHVESDRVEEYYDWGPTGWMRALDEPVADGHTWTTTNGSATFTMTYSNAGSVGGYAECWKVTQNVSYTTYWIYCRGVGLVRYEMVDLSGGTIKAELTTKSF